MKALKKIRYFMEFIITLAAGVCIRVLSPEQTSRFGFWLGRRIFQLGVSRETTLSNLAMIFPEKSEPERRRIAAEAYGHFSVTLLELMRMPLIDPRDLMVNFEFVGLDILEETLKRGKGAVCLSGHFGNWEWMGAALVARGYPLSFMIGTQSNPWVDRLFNSYRTHCDINLIPLKNIKGVLTTLKRNQFVALLGDQDGDRYGQFIDFMGRTASTYTGPAVFARRTGADMLLACSVRLGPRRHKVEIVRLPDPPAGLSEEMDNAFRLQSYNAELGRMVRQHPEQWLWMHRRWVSRPEHHLQGEDRRKAEAGQWVFDTREQCWRQASDGLKVGPGAPESGVEA